MRDEEYYDGISHIGGCYLLSKFIAFKLSSGESFYIETMVNKRKKTVLVDGGEGRAITDHFKNVVRRDKVNVVVCTHQDSDHSRGIHAFLSRYHCDEVWLPAEWGDLYGYFKNTPDIIKTFLELDSLVRGFESEKREEVPTIEYLEEYISSKVEAGKEEEECYFEDYKHIEIENIEMVYSALTLMNLGLSDIGFSNLSKDVSNLVSEIIGHYKNIVNIAALALNKGILIRWFEYQEEAPLRIHKNDPLIPLNSKEVLQIKRFKSSTEFLLQLVSQFNLSTTNRRCLVFSTNWKNKKTPPILLTADSNLDGKEVEKANFKSGMIITVPHHGSKNNKPAFDKIKCKIVSKRIDRTNWVKSFHQAVDLDSWYLKDILEIKGGTKRYCTKCENSHVEFKFIQRRWKRIKTKKRRDGCTCTSK
ncbi:MULTISPECIES: MBL fold metallo-hydrolase [Paenibacillus]|uniref:MBL fold metallo-hydrolase n=1 Tax=Paenibacillus TaxID=44249 RepID=UPI0009A7E618|nr:MULTISPECIES: MBL fold metallo-hydrolase [Paenibacillus]SLK16471.1 Metallo-beta-lactamase superfamily protein [Paenibacillus sp. RU5A]SOC74385.1 Metallo-beta-lactamase superfamily protein [Paenibacillus sp. RU26A]SOC76518.1 Metallo-beta-lactamase superfamily protein [Paenibacillus sp. RU5M]